MTSTTSYMCLFMCKRRLKVLYVKCVVNIFIGPMRNSIEPIKNCIGPIRNCIGPIRDRIGWTDKKLYLTDKKL